MKKIFSIMMAIIVFCSAVVATTDVLKVSVAAAGTTEASNIKYKKGDLVEFGSYPQKRVTSSDLIKSLNKITLNWKNDEYESSYKYVYNEKSKSFKKVYSATIIKYADVEYKGEKYRALRITKRDGDYTENVMGYHPDDDAYQYKYKTTYWFKYQPLVWRVLDPETGTVICESVIDVKPFSKVAYLKDYVYYTSSECDAFAGDYNKSTVRKWLNNTFYETAFSTKEQALFKTTKIRRVELGDFDKTMNAKFYLMSYGEFDAEEMLWYTGRYIDNPEEKVPFSDFATMKADNSESYKQWMLRDGYYDIPEAVGMNLWIDWRPGYCDGIGMRMCVRVDLSSSLVKQVKPDSLILLGISNRPNGIRLAWERNYSSDQVYVYRKTADTSWKKIATVSAEKCSFVDENAKQGVEYIYTAKGKNEAGTGSYNKKGLKCQFVKTPQNFKVEYVKDGFKLSWSKVSGADGYKIYGSDVSYDSFARPLKVIESGNTCSCTIKYSEYDILGDKKIQLGESCINDLNQLIFVRAYKKDTRVSYSAPSTKESVRVLVKPNAKLANSSKGIKVSWSYVVADHGDGPEQYYVYKLNDDGKYKLLEKVDGSKKSFVDTSVKAGKKYTYKVRARTDGVFSSSSITSTTFVPCTTLNSAISAQKGISLKWSKVEKAEGYIIYRKCGSGSYKKLKTETGINNLSYCDKTAEKGKQYSYKIKAYIGKNYSAYSNVKTLKDKY